MRRPAIVIFLLAGASLGVLFYPCTSLLEISSVKAGDILWSIPMKAGEEFILSFTHSVNKRPVYDTLKVQGDHLVIVKSVYDSFGAGMPEGTTAEGQLMVLPDGWLQWSVAHPVPEVIVRVGEVANHTLMIKARTFPLTELAEPGTALVFRVRLVSLFAALKGWCRQ